MILDAVASWEKIAKAQRGFLFVLGLHLLPLMAITLGIESYALVRLGEKPSITGLVKPVPQELAIQYGLAAAALNLTVVLLGAKFVQQVARSFHFEAGYVSCFTALAYGISPLLLAHLLDALPGINTWVCFGIGIALTVGLLYHGVPRVMRPDPAKAMQVFLMTALLVTVLAGAAHFVAQGVLHGELNARFWEQFLK